MVMNFEGDGSMWYDANNPVSLMDTNKDDQVQMESADGSTTAARRMLKGKRKGGKKASKARKARKHGRKQQVKSFNGKQKKHAQRRANKAWRSEKMSRQERKNRRSLEDDTSTSGTDYSFASQCYNEDGTACTFNELIDATSLCDTTINNYAQSMCDSTGMPYRGEICALASYLEADWYMPEILCDMVDEEGTTITSLAGGLCNAW